MSDTTKRYIVSSIVTFIAGFALAIYPLLNDISIETLTKASIGGLLFAGTRAGIKALIEYLFIK